MSSAASGSLGAIGNPDQLVGTMDFYEGGDVNIFTANPDAIDEDVLDTFKLTVAFVLHALNRADWMSDFFFNHYDGEVVNPDQSTSENSRSHLTLIKGGKDD